jgi:circadian clock protein KaiC
VTAIPATTRVSSGESSIDAVLGGGILTNSITLLAGAPGSGKTMLAQQYAFAAATIDRPALILTTLNEPLDKVVRFGQTLSFFDREAVGTRVLYESLADVVATDGLPGVTDRIMVLLSTLRPAILVIDSFRALNAFAGDADYRQFVSELGQRLSAASVTSIWVGEYQANVLETPEAAVADAIVLLRSEKLGPRRMRTIEVLKLRGSGFLAGEHGYRLNADGLHAFVRVADSIDTEPTRLEQPRISLGQERLDAMLSGGVWPGTSTLLIGASGTGKTILALDFLSRGAAAGHPGLFATLQESRSQMSRVFWSAGRDRADDRLEFHHRSPVDIDIDEWVADLFDTLARRRVTLLVIDSVSDLRLASRDDKRFEEFVYSLSQRLSQRGVTTLMTLEAPPSIGVTQLPSSPLSAIADNIILLGYRVHDGKVGRAIHVLKTRSSAHDPTIRSFEITDAGPVIGEPIELPSDPAAPAWTSRQDGRIA